MIVYHHQSATVRVRYNNACTSYAYCTYLRK